MRFYKAKIILMTSVLVVGLFDTPVQADNANPPVITSVEQITKGPYSIGDVVSYKVNFSGGEPSIEGITIFLKCLFGVSINEEMISSRSSKDYVYKSPDFKIVSGWLKPCSQNIVQPTKATISDSTRLGSTLDLSSNTALSFEVVPSDLSISTPVGEIKPKKIADLIDLKVIPLSAKVKKSFILPRLTSGGVPIFWRTQTPNVCTINTAFRGDLGGTLVLNKPGNCSLPIASVLVEKFEFPKIITKAKVTNFGSGSLISIQIKK